ncbi:uncharacterized protein LOC120334073 [Styela clava]
MESSMNMTFGTGATSIMTSYPIGNGDVITETEKKLFENTSTSSTAMIVTQGVLYGVILCVGMLFNCCVIWLIRHKRSLHTVTNMWVTSLCISQSLICAISLPVMLLSVMADDWILGNIFCRIFGFYTTCLRTVSILSVAGIALDRYHIVTRPFSARIRKSSARVLIVLTWWSGLFSAVPPLLGIGLYRYSPNSHMCGVSWSLGGSALIFSVFYITSVYVMSLMTTTYSYKLIYQVTRAQAEKRKRPSFAGGLGSSLKSSGRSASRRGGSTKSGRGHEYTNGSTTDDEAMQVNTQTVKNKKGSPARRRLTSAIHGKLSRSKGSLRNRLSASLGGGYSHASIDSRAALTIGLVLTVFLLSWIPYFAYGLYSAIAGGEYNKTSTAHPWIEFVTTWLSFSNVVWDPLLYGALNHNFRTHLREWYCCSKANFKIFKKSKEKFANSDIYDENHYRRSTNVAANWREIIKNEEKTERENAVIYGRGVSFVEDSQEQMSESAHTMTSLDGDVILSSPSSKRRSTEPPTNWTNSKIFFLPEGGENRVVIPDIEKSPRSRLPIVYTPTSLRQDIVSKQLNYSPRSMTSQRFGASRDSIFDNDQSMVQKNEYASTFIPHMRKISNHEILRHNDVITMGDRRHAPPNSKLRESREMNSPLPLAMTYAGSGRTTPGSNMSSFRLNERMSSSRKYAKNEKYGKNSTEIFFTENDLNSGLEGANEKQISKSRATLPAVQDPHGSSKPISTSSTFVSGTPTTTESGGATISGTKSAFTPRTKLSSESGRRRIEKVRNLPRHKYNNESKNGSLSQSATPL